MNRLNKLNGWQRIWLVISILCLFFLITFSVYLINEGKPTKPGIKEKYKEELIALVDEDYRFRKLSYEDKRKVVDRLLKDKNLFNKFKAKYSNNNFSKIEEKFYSVLKKLRKLRFHYFTKSFVVALLAWLILLFIIYIFGLSVGWIIKGFKKGIYKMLSHRDMWKELMDCECKVCEDVVIADEKRINNTFLYHSFPRRANNGDDKITKGITILKSIVENGLLLNCESIKFKEPLSNGQLSSPTNLMSICCSFTLLEEHELIKHSNKFGNFSLEFETQALRKLGAIPTFYIPNPEQYHNTNETLGSAIICRLSEIPFILECFKKKYDLKTISHSNPHYKVDIDHHINIIHRIASLFYPTERNINDELMNYYRQKEWRIIGSIKRNKNEVTRKLSQEQKKTIVEIDPEFFNGELENRNGQMVKRIDLCQIYKDFDQKPFIEYVRRIIVPDRAFDEACKIVSILDNPPEIVSLNYIQKVTLIKCK